MSAMQILDDDPTGTAAAEGEITAFTPGLNGACTVRGEFRPGDALHLRPGRPVVVLGNDEYRDLLVGYNEAYAQLEEERDEAQDRADVSAHELRNAESELEKLRAQILDLEGQLVDAQEQLNGALKHQT